MNVKFSLKQNMLSAITYNGNIFVKKVKMGKTNFVRTIFPPICLDHYG